MLTPEAAWAAIAKHSAPLPGELVDRAAALGRVLAEPLPATVDVPPADVSAMDGYAVAGDYRAGEQLPVAGMVAAGDPPGIALAPATALRIMTGAPLPIGADRVVAIELTDGGRSAVTLRAVVPAGEAIRRRAEVTRVGDELLPAGSRLAAGALALLATHGHARIPVHRKPRVAVLATGNEVVPPDSAPRPGQLRDSHTDFLHAACRGLGLEIESLGIAPDDPEELAARAARGLAADLLLLCGGVSMGELDFTAGALARLDCETVFAGVAVQPGRPLVFARHAGGLVFGLPGNPASVMVCFWLFLRPLLRRWLGQADGYWQGALTAELAAPLPGARDRARFLPAAATAVGGRLLARPVAVRGSHDLAAYARGNALIRVPAGSPPAPAGAACEVLPLADWPLAPG